MANQPDPKFPTFSDLYSHLLTLPAPLLPPGKATSPSLTASISALGLHPTLEVAFHILNNDLPSAHFLVRHMQSPPAYEGMFLHGILHRIESDYDNARAWYDNVSESDVFKHTWVGGKGEALDFVLRVETLKKAGKGNKSDLEKESLDEIKRVVEWCKKQFGEQRMEDASDAWVKPSEENRKMAEDMPPPEASRSRILSYLTEFLIEHFECPDREAYDLARKFQWDGYLLYRFSARQFNELFEYRVQDRNLGLELYLELQFGPYGKYVNFWFYGPFLSHVVTILGVLLTVSEIEEKSNSHPGAGIGTSVLLNAALYMAFCYCASSRQFDNRTFPDCFKARRWCNWRLNQWVYLVGILVMVALIPVLVLLRRRFRA